jgi:N6-adenosine-specific RNA methylase IME4
MPGGDRAAVVYADPPWGWSQSALANRGAARTVEKEYATMPAPRGHAAAEIEALPVNDWTADNAVLFLWATGPKLLHALAVMVAWGFTYKTIGFCWVKRNRKAPSLFWGMGFFTRANVELGLIGTKGKGLKRKDAGVHQVVEAPVSIHSRKPAEVRRRIERLYDGPYLELFARERPPGWRVWGDGVPEEAA